MWQPGSSTPGEDRWKLIQAQNSLDDRERVEFAPWRSILGENHFVYNVLGENVQTAGKRHYAAGILGRTTTRGVMSINGGLGKGPYH